MEIRRMVLEAVGLSFEKNDRELKYIDAFGRNKVQLWELSNTSTNLTAIKKLIPYEYPVRANDFHLFEEAIGEKFDREISLYCSKQESVLVYLSKKHSKIYIIRHLLLSWGG